MNKSEVLELKRRFKKNVADFSCIKGCYVDASKQKVTYVDYSSVGALEDEELLKYIEIAKKCLSGALGNNLIEREFSLSDIQNGNNHKSLMALKSTQLYDKNMLDAFYDHIIETYDYVGNYLILLFHDVYDVPGKTTDNAYTGESECVYDYLLCAICPVKLSKAALGYKTDENLIKRRERDWVVDAPESGFLFPAFNDRASDINNILFYTKNPKEPHKEFWSNTFGLEETFTSAEKTEAFAEIIKNTIKETTTDEKIVNERFVKVEATIDEFLKNDSSIENISSKDMKNIFIESGLDEIKAENICKKYEKLQEEMQLKADVLVDESVLKKSDLILENVILKKKIVELEAIIKQLKEKAA